jgi:hypothetical protein
VNISSKEKKFNELKYEGGRNHFPQFYKNVVGSEYIYYDP